MGDKKPKGIWPRSGKLWIDIKTPAGRLRKGLGLSDTAKNRKHAEHMLGEIRLKITLGTFNAADYFGEEHDAVPEEERLSFGQFAGQWLTGQDHLAKATWEAYRKILNCYWLPIIGDSDIAAITGTEVNAAVASIEWKSSKTRNNAISPLKRVFEAAMDDGLIQRDPTARLKFAKVQKQPPDPLTEDEAERVLAWMVRYPIWHNYFEFAFFTGMRTSELIAVRWGDVDWTRKTCRVQRARVRREVKTTKTATERDVELHRRAIDALRRQKQHTFLVRDGDASDWIFRHPATGHQINDDKPARLVWTDALKACGIRHRDAYVTRHTFATMALMAGADSRWIARQLGHANLMMLATRYSRWMDGDDKGRELARFEGSTSQLRHDGS